MDKLILKIGKNVKHFRENYTIRLAGILFPCRNLAFFFSSICKIIEISLNFLTGSLLKPFDRFDLIDPRHLIHTGINEKFNLV